jgi:hypothetical protein
VRMYPSLFANSAGSGKLQDLMRRHQSSALKKR